jgi:Bacterial extracellular solute-binding proteins, family 3
MIWSSDSSYVIKEQKIKSNSVTEFVCESKPSKVNTINFIIDDYLKNSDILNDVLSTKSFEFPFEIENYQNTLKMQNHKKFFSVLLFNNFETICKFCNAITHDNYYFNGFFVLVMEDFSLPKLKNIFEIFWRKFIFNVDILIKSDNSQNLSVFTFMPFISESCGDLEPIKINQFNERTMNWDTGVFFPKKFQNLQKCSLKVGSIGNLFGTMVKIMDNKTQHFYGFEVDCLKEIASTLNLTLMFKIYPYEAGLIFKNKTGTGMIKRVQEKEVDLICGSFSLQQQRREILSDTRSFYSDKMILVVPQAEVISSIEKLLLPFDLYIWISLVITISLSFSVITLLKFLPKHIEILLSVETSKTVIST